MLDQPPFYFLGPMGGEDPTTSINAETNRIPFRQTKTSLSAWHLSFRSSPSKLPRWRDWYQRMMTAKYQFWSEIGIAQCLSLSLAEMKKNEPLMSLATYFWSDTMNAFLFNYGLMTPTLLDVTMLTGSMYLNRPILSI